MSYKVKEVFYSLQGEGFNSGRPAVFCRFAGCNLWSGLEKHRSKAECQFCDTNFLGTDGAGGRIFATAQLLAAHLALFVPNWLSENQLEERNLLVVFTGGEPLLQLDETLIEAVKQYHFEVAVETNGTIKPPKGIDWLCVSPKNLEKTLITQCNELKLVFPQAKLSPKQFEYIKSNHYFISPMANFNPEDSNIYSDATLRDAVAFCKQNPKWRLSLQIHKMINIR